MEGMVICPKVRVDGSCPFAGKTCRHRTVHSKIVSCTGDRCINEWLEELYGCTCVPFEEKEPIADSLFEI